MSTKPTIVFGPGAWHSPSCFQLVRDAMHQRGWETEAVTYPSVGAEPATLGLQDDAQALHDALDGLINQAKDVVLVVHSYGGLVGSSAAKGLGQKQRAEEGKAGGIIMLVYLAAFVLPMGNSILDALGGQYPPWWRIEGDRVYVDNPAEVLYHDVESGIQQKAINALTHECIMAFMDKADHEPWHEMESMYILCEADKAIPAVAQASMAARLGSDAIVIRTKASHSPFLSEIQDVLEGVERAAQLGLKRKKWTFRSC